MAPRILAASDGTAPAEHAAGLAQFLAGSVGGQCAVLGVDTGGLPSVWTPSGPVIRDTLSSATLWAHGVPGVEIARKAESWNAGLVVLGRRPRNPESPRPLGPTAEMVLRRNPGATLLAPVATTRIRRALVALDGTSRGLAVLERAGPFLRAWVPECHLITVLPAELPEDESWSDPRRTRVTEAVESWRGHGAPPVLHFRHGSPVRLIRQMAQELHADVLVLGVRRGGPAGDMGSGHIGRDLLSIVPCAILCVPI